MRSETLGKAAPQSMHTSSPGCCCSIHDCAGCVAGRERGWAGLATGALAEEATAEGGEEPCIMRSHSQHSLLAANGRVLHNSKTAHRKLGAARTDATWAPGPSETSHVILIHSDVLEEHTVDSEGCQRQHGGICA